jgi:hypothetical protein
MAKLFLLRVLDLLASSRRVTDLARDLVSAAARSSMSGDARSRSTGARFPA